MIDLSVLCDRFYPIEQGYITDERGVQIEHGWDDGPIPLLIICLSRTMA
jgi:hypothetical protein